MIRLLIKGTFTDAREALDKRRILTCMALQQTTAHYVDAVVDDESETDLARWLCEPCQTTPGKGYPPGTLLYYMPYTKEG